MKSHIIDYRITFFVKEQGLPPPVASQLTRLAKKFKCLVHIDNITQNLTADAASSLGLLKAGLRKGDFCQLVTTGLEAEWANFVFTDLLSSTFDFVASDKLGDFSERIEHTRAQLSPQCDVDFHYVKAQVSLSKFEILTGLSQLIYPQNADELLRALMQREQLSPTAMAKQIALPHVICPYVEKPTIAIIRSDYAIDWASKMGEVNLIIALVLPDKTNREMLMAATYLTRNLLSADFSQRLVNTRQPKGLQALILYAMCHLLD